MRMPYILGFTSPIRFQQFYRFARPQIAPVLLEQNFNGMAFCIDLRLDDFHTFNGSNVYVCIYIYIILYYIYHVSVNPKIRMFKSSPLCIYPPVNQQSYGTQAQCHPFSKAMSDNHWVYPIIHYSSILHPVLLLVFPLTIVIPQDGPPSDVCWFINHDNLH